MAPGFFAAPAFLSRPYSRTSKMGPKSRTLLPGSRASRSRKSVQCLSTPPALSKRLECAFSSRQGTPVPLRKHLATHQVATAFELSWNNLKNGELLQMAEENGFSVLVTTDQNLRYQQNLMDHKIAIVVLTTTSWPRIERVVASVAKAVDSTAPGSYIEVSIP